DADHAYRAVVAVVAHVEFGPARENAASAGDDHAGAIGTRARGNDRLTADDLDVARVAKRRAPSEATAGVEGGGHATPALPLALLAGARPHVGAKLGQRRP